jgi:hypothetical protein
MMPLHMPCIHSALLIQQPTDTHSSCEYQILASHFKIHSPASTFTDFSLPEYCSSYSFFRWLAISSRAIGSGSNVSLFVVAIAEPVATALQTLALALKIHQLWKKQMKPLEGFVSFRFIFKFDVILTLLSLGFHFNHFVDNMMSLL